MATSPSSPLALELWLGMRSQGVWGYSRPLPTVHRKAQSPAGHLRGGKGQRVLLGVTGSARREPHPHHRLCTGAGMAVLRVRGSVSHSLPQVRVPAGGSAVLRWYKRFLCFLQMGKTPSRTTGSVSATEMICQGNVSTGNRFSPPHHASSSMCTCGHGHLGGRPPGWESQAELLNFLGVYSKNSMEKLSRDMSYHKWLPSLMDIAKYQQRYRDCGPHWKRVKCQIPWNTA